MQAYIVFFVIFLCNIAQAQELKIASDELTYYKGEGKSVFYGNVYVKSRDISLYAQKLIVKQSENKVSKIEAFDKIKIVTKDEVAFGDYCWIKNDIIHIEGNVKMIQNKNEVFGDVFEYNQKTKQAILRSTSSKKVKAIISLEDVK